MSMTMSAVRPMATASSPSGCPDLGTSRLGAADARDRAGPGQQLSRPSERPRHVILDDFAMRQMTATQADDLYELVSERQGRSVIITSNRAPSDW
ncbi:hypothetical protein ACFVJM_35910 [Streptomyces virginiae]|uniref:hypothetical protein n=1 Tax=Streptomyces virginiae TaxID=1961 RepID=UPI00363A4F96